MTVSIEETPATAVTVRGHGRLVGVDMANGRRTCAAADCGRSAEAKGYCLMHYARWKKYGDPLHLVRIRGGSPAEQLQFYVAQGAPDECWPWRGHIHGNGYGVIHRKPAHRLAYETWVGPIPEGLVIDHVCHNRDSSCSGGFTCLHRRCCNPAHLEATLQVINMERGRGISAVNTKKTHCSKGHPFNAQNTRVESRSNRGTGRICKICEREWQRRYKARRQAGTP